LQDWIDQSHSMTRPEATPHWLETMVAALADAAPADLSTNDPAAVGLGSRQAAVLILLGGSAEDGPMVVLLERARGLRDHGGEIGFPGGGWEPADASPVVTALREAREEIGVDPDGIDPLIVLPRLVIRASGFDVTAVVGYWREPGPIGPADPAETGRVLTVGLRDIAQPDRWSRLTVPGWSGPSVVLDDGTVVWGYTAELLAFMCRNV
jgi:8-oxo-dGTP pyrophosphatase MutT (NUDIX family)